MSISFMAMNRMVEQKAAQDAAYRKSLAELGKKTLASGRALTDEVLLEKLQSLGVEIDREWLGQAAGLLPSAQLLAEKLIGESKVDIPELQVDWVWIAVVCLWERWLPDVPGFELIDDWMQAGYEAWNQNDLAAARGHWRRTWRGIEHVRQTLNVKTIAEFDNCFGGSQCVFNWVQDYSSALYNATLDEDSAWRELADLGESVLSSAKGSERDRALIEPMQNYLEECRVTLRERNEEFVPSDAILDQIISELDQPYDGTLPKQALRDAQRFQTTITPRLIRLIERATAIVLAGKPVETNGHCFALFLLAEFKAKEAWPAIRAAISLPGEGPFELFGDAVTESLSGLLAVLVDKPEEVDDLISNGKLNEYVRWEAAQTYRYWVRDGHITRREALERLGQHVRDATEAKDDYEITTGLLCELVTYSPRELLGDIRKAYRLNLVDESMIDLRTIEEAVSDGDAWFEREMQGLGPSGIDDTVAELSAWYAYQEPDKASPRESPWLPSDQDEDVDTWDDDTEHEVFSVPSETIRSTKPKVSRNDPCPCGSGKKYKKCCLPRNDQSTE